jgi:hypothetical protein
MFPDGFSRRLRPATSPALSDFTRVVKPISCKGDSMRTWVNQAKEQQLKKKSTPQASQERNLLHPRAQEAQYACKCFTSIVFAEADKIAANITLSLVDLRDFRVWQGFRSSLRPGPGGVLADVSFVHALAGEDQRHRIRRGAVALPGTCVTYNMHSRNLHTASYVHSAGRTPSHSPAIWDANKRRDHYAGHACPRYVFHAISFDSSLGAI